VWNFLLLLSGVSLHLSAISVKKIDNDDCRITSSASK
jgi:hypothetical protein